MTRFEFLLWSQNKIISTKEAKMTTNRSAQCLCGKIKMTISSENNKVGACHCSMCRRFSGGPMLGLDCGADVSIDAGNEHLGLYQSSAYGERGFCKNCGSSLFWKMRDANHYVVSAGILDDPSQLVLNSQIFIDEKPDFYSFANDTKNMTGAEFMAQFS